MRTTTPFIKNHYLSTNAKKEILDGLQKKIYSRLAIGYHCKNDYISRSPSSMTAWNSFIYFSCTMMDSKKEWHKIIAELQLMFIALPVCAGLFFILQEAFWHEEAGCNRLHLSNTLHGFLNDFRWLARDLTSRPTRIAVLIPDEELWTEGACDAAGDGMGGIRFTPTTSDAGNDNIETIFWWHPFPQWIWDRLSFFHNTRSNITYSNLKMAGSVANMTFLQNMQMSRTKPFTIFTITFWQFTDNTKVQR